MDNGPAGPLPQSEALAEADPASLSELFSRDPEGYTNRDLDQIILELRAQRERQALAEASGSQAKVKATRQGPQVSTRSAEDLGL